jgi:hypothetical protein
MDEAQALAKMVPPSKPRKNAWRGGIIQIWVTRSCDKACFGCTQGSNLAGKSTDITPEQFEEAVLSLKGFWGVYGVFGGNPAVAKHFEAYCEILRKHVPQEQCGLWCNKLFGKGKIAAKTFNPKVSNLNVHLDQAAFDEFKRDWPGSRPFGLKEDSRHAPVYVAMQDVVDADGNHIPEAEQWDKIANCDINQNWSSMICVFRNQLRGFFCEIAGAQAMLHQHEPDYPDTGVAVVPGWWQRPMTDFAAQVRLHCKACGVPLRGYGSLAQDESGIEQVSATHASIYNPKRVGREVQLVQLRSEVSEEALTRVTDYVQNSKVKKS